MNITIYNCNNLLIANFRKLPKVSPRKGCNISLFLLEAELSTKAGEEESPTDTGLLMPFSVS